MAQVTPLTTTPGWEVSHPQYGKWFISRQAVIDDWKQDQAQAYPENAPREPEDDEVETWFAEQTSWIEVHAFGVQLERPDMAAVEAAWLRGMARDADYVAIDSDPVEIKGEIS